MDVILKVNADGNAWTMTDLLGHNMGNLSETQSGTFMIEPAGQAVETMKALTKGPYKSLDAALAAIEEHTRGVCRRG